MSGDPAGPSNRFGELLRRHRLAAGLTQEELADRSGLSVRTIGFIENGRTIKPYRHSVRSLADALGLADPLFQQLSRECRLIVSGRVPPGAELSVRTADHALGPVQTPMSPRMLPAAVPRFVGRADELDALSAIAADAEPGGPVAIAAVSGTAGVGKSALAVRWAHRVADKYPRGQLYADLRGYHDGPPVPPGDVLEGFLRALGVRGPDIPPGVADRAALYRSLIAGQPVLLVLDNARDSAQVRPLLPGTARCLTLVTSRDSLAGLVARDGARRVVLDRLPLADAVELLRILIGARADDDAPSVRALAGLCCRLPLALRVAAELACAQPGAGLAGLVGELADQQRRLDLLDAGGDADTAVRAALSWSYLRLDTAAARMFRHFGLYPGADLDGHAAAALAGATVGRARQLLTQLARAHLIQPTEAGRYGMHDLLRSYARELAVTYDGEQQRRAALSRLLDHYLHTAAVTSDSRCIPERRGSIDIFNVSSPAPSPELPARAPGAGNLPEPGL